MTHLGQRLSALVDGELDIDERERVLGHLAKCGWCREEAAALRTLKRRMNALRETVAGASLTEQLIELSSTAHGEVWPQSATGWQTTESNERSASKTSLSRFFLAGSIVVFLAGLGSAAFIAGGDPQTPAPAPNITPSVDVFLLQHEGFNGVNLNVNPRQPSSGSGSGKSPFRAPP